MSMTEFCPPLWSEVGKVGKVVPAVSLFGDTDAEVTVAALLADYPHCPEVATSVDTILRIWGPEKLSEQLDILTEAGVHGLEKLADRLAADYVEDIMSAPSPAPSAA
ncbi:hypothetical protein ACTXK0_03015 [Corynebacterium variabile]|uniref:hypothetical protein n=1 Tax=Corynebacterium variabile TaxID=1727 RepID=UPI003FD039FB